MIAVWGKSSADLTQGLSVAELDSELAKPFITPGRKGTVAGTVGQNDHQKVIILVREQKI